MVIVGWFGITPNPVAAQSPVLPYPVALEGPANRLDEFHQRLDPEAALDLADSLLLEDATNYEYLWRAARAAVSLGMLAGVPKETSRYFDRAEAYARDAVDVNPDGTMGHHFVAVTMGQRALNQGIRTRVAMAEEVRQQAEIVLALDSTFAGAYHVLGRWHAEVKRLGRVSGFLARRLFGGDRFGDASWEEAERLMRHAIELDPYASMHALELARILIDTDRPDEARAELSRALDLPVREPIDPLYHQQAQELLRELGG
jgi:tetratricopeptide (TPR) repeat protein